MSKRTVTATISTLIAILTLSGAGCTTSGGPFLGIVSVPICITPHMQQKEEDKFWFHERYARAPILGPTTSGGPPKALDPPSDDEIIRALEKVRPLKGGFPFLYERQRNDVEIVKEVIADYTDPPRFYPLVGPAQQHHAHYKCTIYFRETDRIGWPLPHTVSDEDAVEVVYIDHNHLHMVGNVDPGVGSNY